MRPRSDWTHSREKGQCKYPREPPWVPKCEACIRRLKKDDVQHTLQENECIWGSLHLPEGPRDERPRGRPKSKPTIQSRRSTATQLRGFRELYEEKFSERRPRTNLPNKTKKKGQRFHQPLPPAAQARHLGNQALQEGLDQTQLQLALIQLGYRRRMSQLSHALCVGQIEIKEPGGLGPTQRSVPQIQISGWIST